MNTFRVIPSIDIRGGQCVRLFQGDYGALVSHLLSDHEIDRKELTRLRALIAEKGKKEGRRGR